MQTCEISKGTYFNRPYVSQRLLQYLPSSNVTQLSGVNVLCLNRLCHYFSIAVGRHAENEGRGGSPETSLVGSQCLQSSYPRQRTVPQRDSWSLRSPVRLRRYEDRPPGRHRPQKAVQAVSPQGPPRTENWSGVEQAWDGSPCPPPEPEPGWLPQYDVGGTVPTCWCLLLRRCSFTFSLRQNVENTGFCLLCCFLLKIPGCACQGLNALVRHYATSLHWWKVFMRQGNGARDDSPNER